MKSPEMVKRVHTLRRIMNKSGPELMSISETLMLLPMFALLGTCALRSAATNCPTTAQPPKAKTPKTLPRTLPKTVLPPPKQKKKRLPPKTTPLTPEGI